MWTKQNSCRLAFACLTWVSASAYGAEVNPPSTPLPDYQSGFQGYESWQPVGSRDWRAANDRVAEIGGWRTYAREGESHTSPAAHPQHPPGTQSKGHQHPGGAR